MAKNKIDIGECEDLKPHELKTAKVLVKYGSVRFLEPSRVEGVHTPDVVWLGLKWEIKSPKGKGKELIPNTINKAIKQSGNVIIDFRRLQMSEQVAMRMVRKYALEFKKLKRLKVVTKQSKILDIKG